MIEIKKIKKTFENETALQDVDFTIKEGGVFGLVGSNGAGKSTLLNIIGLLDEPSEGEYLFYDESMSNIKEKKKVEYHRNYFS